MSNEHTFLLKDNLGNLQNVTVRQNGNFLEVCPEGYAAEGPVVLDLFDGVLSVHVYGDVNDETPTRTECLEGARETLRAN